MGSLFTAKVTAKGGRAGHIKSDDGVLDFNIVMPNAKKTEKQEQILSSCLQRDMQHASAEPLSMLPRNKRLTSIQKWKAKSAS